MLASRHRITAAEDFRATMRGSRAAGAHLVVHLSLAGDRPPRAGFVVSKAVGVAVVRNLVKRRLRHLIAAHLQGRHLPALPTGASLVVRALPSAAGASYADLASDLERQLTRALARVAA